MTTRRKPPRGDNSALGAQAESKGEPACGSALPLSPSLSTSAPLLRVTSSSSEEGAG